MKNSTIKLLLIAACVLWGLNLKVGQAPYNSGSINVLFWIINGLQLLMYFSLLLITAMLYRLIKIYNKDGFHDLQSLNLIRLIGLSLVGLAAFDITNQTLVVLAKHPDISLSHLLQDFLGKVLLISPTLLFCGILIFILAEFMNKAILVKLDNETII